MTDILAHWFSSDSTQWELSNEYKHDRVWMVLKIFHVLVLRTKVAPALEGLRIPPESVTWTTNTSENDLETEIQFAKYLKESCR